MEHVPDPAQLQQAPRLVALQFCQHLAAKAGVLPLVCNAAGPAEQQHSGQSGADGQQAATTGQAQAQATTAAPQGPLSDSSEAAPAAAATLAGRALLASMLDAVQSRTVLTMRRYTKGDGTHRLKLRAWQALCLLCCFVHPADEEELIQQVVAELQHPDVASVKQYAERSAFPAMLTDSSI